MESRPVMRKPKVRVSIVVLGVISCISLMFGLLSLLFKEKLTPELQAFSSIIGISFIVASAFLFIIVNIASDLQCQRHLQEYYVEEAKYYHTQSMLMLQSVEVMLRQQQYQQQGPFVPTSYMPGQYVQPPEVNQSGPSSFDAQSKAHVQYPAPDKDNYPYESDERNTNEYRAHYARSVSHKEETPALKKEEKQ